MVITSWFHRVRSYRIYGCQLELKDKVIVYRVMSYGIYGCQLELKDKVIVYRGKWYRFKLKEVILVSRLQGLGAI